MSKDELREILNVLEPIIGKGKAKRYWKLWLLEDRDGREKLQRELEFLQEKLTKQGYASTAILLNPPDKERIQGSMPVGKTHYNGKDIDTFSMNPELFLRHVTIFGTSGSGKTNLGYTLLLNLLRQKIPFLVLDWKRNYRDIRGFTAGERANVQIYTVGKKTRPFCFNPLIPPKGTSPKAWLKKLVEIIGKAYYVGEGVISILHKGIDAVYAQAGVYNTEPVLHWPTMHDVKKWVEEYVQRASYKELKAQWIASTGRTLQSLCFGDMDEIINDEINDLNIETLLNKPVVLELDGLTDNDKTFIIETILLWIHHYRLQDKVREKLKHVILIEEAHHVLRKKLATDKEGIIDVVIREIRELGEGLVMITQNPADFSQNATANSATTFTFNLKDRTDVLTASKFLLLDEEQQHYLNNLPIGYCITKTQNITKPFLLHLPHIPVKKGSTTDEIIQNQETDNEQGWKGILERLENANRVMKDTAEVFQEHSEQIQANNFAEDDVSIVRTESTKSRTDTPPPNERSQIQPSPQTDREENLEMWMLYDIVKNPYSGVNARYSRLNISTRHGIQTKKRLIMKELVKNQEITTPEGKTVILELTDKSRKLLRKKYPHLKLPTTRNGTEHRYWKNRIGEQLKKQGLTVEYEKRIPEGRADIIVHNGKTHIIEIETGKSNLKKKRPPNTTTIGTNPSAREKTSKL